MKVLLEKESTAGENVLLVKRHCCSIHLPEVGKV